MVSDRDDNKGQWATHSLIKWLTSTASILSLVILILLNFLYDIVKSVFLNVKISKGYEEPVLSYHQVKICKFAMSKQLRTQPLFSPACADATYGNAQLCRWKNVALLQWHGLHVCRSQLVWQSLTKPSAVVGMWQSHRYLITGCTSWLHPNQRMLWHSLCTIVSINNCISMYCILHPFSTMKYCHLKTIPCVVIADIRRIPGEPEYHVRLACLDQIPQSVPLFSQCKFKFKFKCVYWQTWIHSVVHRR